MKQLNQHSQFKKMHSDELHHINLSKHTKTTPTHKVSNPTEGKKTMRTGKKRSMERQSEHSTPGLRHDKSLSSNNFENLCKSQNELITLDGRKKSVVPRIPSGFDLDLNKNEKKDKSKENKV